MNNSGVAWGAPFNDVPEHNGWDNVFNVNVKSIFYSTYRYFNFQNLDGDCTLTLAEATTGWVETV